MRNLFDLDNQIVIITGGNGQIGQEFSRILIEYGAKVVIFDLKIDQNFLTKYKRLYYYNVDITNRKQIQDALVQVKKDVGIPTALINNAALDFPPNSTDDITGPFEKISEESYDKIMEVNAKGIFLCCQVIGSEMARNEKGSIVNMCSVYGMLSPHPEIYDYKNMNGEEWNKPCLYCISKAVLLNLSKYLAIYWAKKKVRVNCLTPSGVLNHQDSRFLKNYSKSIPIGRMAEVTELDGAIIYLISDASTYYTGNNLVVDGGWTAW